MAAERFVAMDVDLHLQLTVPGPGDIGPAVESLRKAVAGTDWRVSPHMRCEAHWVERGTE